jgi:hypothetical protein
MEKTDPATLNTCLSWIASSTKWDGKNTQNVKLWLIDKIDFTFFPPNSISYSHENILFFLNGLLRIFYAQNIAEIKIRCCTNVCMHLDDGKPKKTPNLPEIRGNLVTIRGNLVKTGAIWWQFGAIWWNSGQFGDKSGQFDENTKLPRVKKTG